MEGRKLAENDKRHKPVPPDVCLPGEVWRDVLGYEGLYSVSDKGRVYGHKRRGCSGRVLRTNPRSNSSRYLRVHLCMDNSIKSKDVHSLVCTAFNGPRQPGQVCRHLDGNPQNNTPNNLKWGTHKDNYQDSIRHGTAYLVFNSRGQKNPAAKLRASQVIEIRHKAKAMAHAAIASEYGISRQNVGDIVNRRSWRHI